MRINARAQLLMLGVSLAGALHALVWYSVALLDVVPQSRVMAFVLGAVQRNVSKILVTVLLLLLCLYFYAIISWLVWPGQVRL
jgi:ABC-type enterochelin transport system permease subunit